MAKIFNQDQVKLILQSLLFRVKNYPDKIKIRRDGDSVVYSDINVTKGSHSIYIKIYNSDYNPYISLDKHSEVWRSGFFFWQHREIKNLIRQLRNSEPLSSTDVVISKCLPESVTIQFEKTFALDKDKA